MVARVSVDLCLVRHARTAFGADGRFCGSSDPPLDEVGRRQAERLRVRLAPTSFDRVWSSDLRRAVETATIIDRGTPTIDVRLRELDFGTLEGKRWDECTPEVQEALLAFDGFRGPRRGIARGAPRPSVVVRRRAGARPAPRRDPWRGHPRPACRSRARPDRRSR